MRKQDGDDDTAYESAVRRTHITMAIALVVSLLLLGAVALAVFGVTVFLDLAEHFSH
ncbi:MULTISPECIES: hypothetical protein [unclassified Streptomyces]|uniref:hypothetical protein n=1 Tax=unclassified Streptomyces TaxID=2593676 RepID=UPI000A541849|nr:MULTISPECIES: hypothetical protein [unclassified Streptomyces]